MVVIACDGSRQSSFIDSPPSLAVVSDDLRSRSLASAETANGLLPSRKTGANRLQ